MPTPRVSSVRLASVGLLLALALAGQLGVTRVAEAAALVVDRGDDASGLACTVAANDCTLRSAIEIANANGAAADQIGFAASSTINLTNALLLTADNTTIAAQLGQAVRINGAGITTPNIGDSGNVFRITGSGVKLERLAIYGASASWSNIWITGAAQRVSIANNIIGDDESAFGGCGQSPASYSGIYINSTGAVAADAARVWVYGNVIKCNQGTAGSALNPGDGISIVDSDRVVIGANESGASTLAERNYIENNRRNGVTISGSSANNRVLNGVIQFNSNSGVYLDGAQSTIVARNSIQFNSNSGVELVNGTSGSRIGSPLGGPLDDGNLIVFNSREGIYVAGSGTQTNFIFGNKIGVDSSGYSPRGNGLNGIAITDGARSTIVGVTASERNIISGNGHSGIVITGAAANNLVQGNYIGTNIDGNAAISNGGAGVNAAQRAGVALLGSADNNTVGGTTVSNRNLISGNVGSGVYIGDAGTSGNLIDGNYIGTTAAGTSALGNGGAGIAIVNTVANTIGHNDQANPQFIGGNGAEGIAIQNTDGTLIRTSNVIGFSGATTIPGNGREGVLLVNASNTTIAPYVVMNNGRAGVAITGASSVGNAIIFTENRGNGGLAIDLGNTGLTPNDPGDTDSGPNTLLNYPVITSVSGTTISGTACAGCYVYIYRADGPVGYAFGGGGLLGGTPADSSGNWSRSIPSGYTRQMVTAFASFAGNTSEMTPRPQIYIPLSQK